MIQINQSTCTEEAIALLRKMADKLESKAAYLHSGEVSDTRRYGEARTIGLDIAIITDEEFDV